MYHYVRPVKNSKYPEIKGLEEKIFYKQIKFLSENYKILSDEELGLIIKTKKIPKTPSFFLTFDDGYKDHYKYVFPILNKFKVTGNFYPIINAINEGAISDINKIHFILEKVQNRKIILDEIDKLLFEEKRISLNNLSINQLNLFSRYDDRDTVLIKRLLQYFLEEDIRYKILNTLFNKFVTIDSKNFAKELYLSKNEIAEMHNNNMHFGVHTYSHKWLDQLSVDEQYQEIKKSIDFFTNKLNINDCFSVSYPFGSYNLESLKILKKNNFNYAFTTKVGSLNLKNIQKYLEIPRYDANDLQNI